MTPSRTPAARALQVGGNWVELPAGKYQHVPGNGLTHCQIEARVRHNDLVSHQPEGGWQERVLSVHIKSKGAKRAKVQR